MNEINNIYYYDRTLSFTSLYILIPSYYATIDCKIIMIIQTFFSILHWNNYNNKLYHTLDIIISLYVFIYHLFLVFYLEKYYKNISLFFAVLSSITFHYRKGYREILLNRLNRLNKYKIIYVIPHSLFRFFSFWFVMSVYKKKFNIFLSLIYWFNTFLLSYN